MHNRQEELESAIREAEKFHGHLGPFLIIGVRMGRMIKSLLRTDVNEKRALEISVKVPLATPFSCVIDGIQVTTQCTIGNQKLRAENSDGDITANATIQGSSSTVRITVNREITKMLMNRIAEGTSNETLASKMACVPETQLFRVEKR